MRQRRPADPMDPGDAADPSIMGYSQNAEALPKRLQPIPERQSRALGVRNQYLVNHGAYADVINLNR